MLLYGDPLATNLNTLRYILGYERKQNKNELGDVTANGFVFNRYQSFVKGSSKKPFNLASLSQLLQRLKITAFVPTSRFKRVGVGF